MNLTLATQKGLLSFIDGLTSVYTQTDVFSKSISTTIAKPTAVLTSTDSFSNSPSSKEILQNFYKIIKQIIVTRHASIADSRVCLIFDDLSILLYAGFNVRDILEFVKACRVLIEKVTIIGNVTGNL